MSDCLVLYTFRKYAMFSSVSRLSAQASLSGETLSRWREVLLFLPWCVCVCVCAEVLCSNTS